MDKARSVPAYEVGVGLSDLLLATGLVHFELLTTGLL